MFENSNLGFNRFYVVLLIPRKFLIRMELDKLVVGQFLMYTEVGFRTQFWTTIHVSYFPLCVHLFPNTV